jgi:non-specific protein-tyrosine kinase
MSKLKKAMEKARQTREGLVDLLTGDQEPRSVPETGHPKAAESVCEEVRPVYNQTKVVCCDPETLKKNRIVGLFHEVGISDQLKILRTQVLNKMEEIGGNSLLVTSAKPLEGKTTTAINLAVSLSHKVDHTVLLVDADLRKPELHRFFGCDIQGGLSDYLLGRADIPELMLNPGIEKLVILPGGKPVSNSAELLGAPRMESLIKEMKNRYSDRFIIFDSSSLLVSADPLVFSRFTDAVLLVVEAERTAAKDLEKALGLLKDRTIIGTVFNKAK